MSNEQKLPWAEIKAGLKLAKEAYEVLVNDTDYVKSIRLHLERIDAALQSGNLDIILHCNELVTNEYKSLLLRNNVRFVSQTTLREKEPIPKGYILYDSITVTFFEMTKF